MDRINLKKHVKEDKHEIQVNDIERLLNNRDSLIKLGKSLFKKILESTSDESK